MIDVCLAHPVARTPMNNAELTRSLHREPGASNEAAERPPVRPPVRIDGQALRTASVCGLLLLAIIYTLDQAQPILMPVAIAGLLALLLHPVMRLLARARVPAPVGAAIVVLALLVGLFGSVGVLADPAAKWTGELPKIGKQLERKFRALKEPLKDMRQATEQVEKMTTLESPQQAPRTVVISEGGLFFQTMTILQTVASTLGILFGLLFFLLASGDLFREKLYTASPGGHGQRSAAILRQVQRNLSAYLATITLINLALGVVTGLAMYLLGMPNAVLWGAMAAVLNFVPIVGGVTGVAVIALVGLFTFDQLVAGLTPALVYVSLHLLESQVVTPFVVGRQLTMNPVAIFLAIVFWTWLWGIPGALMAVPLLAMLKGACDEIDDLRPLGEFIGGRSSPARPAAGGGKALHDQLTIP